MTMLTNSEFRIGIGAFEDCFEIQKGEEFIRRGFRIYDRISPNTISFYVGKLAEKCFPEI